MVCTRKHCPRSMYRLSLKGRWNVRSQYFRCRLKNSYCCLFCLDSFKSLGKSSILQKKRRHLAVALLCNRKTWFCNGYVAFKKRVSKNFMNKDACLSSLLFSPKFSNQTKLPYFSTVRYIRNNCPLSRMSKPVKMQH